ncbi:hypothetical protein PGTUg99_018976 [Puccinia graminis f. sp. tritici]|uniref:Uncharacterized protein n=1 Tax=Puccinia graminis f. sp. tritici TaxID=56615 RepID=A0A5B0PJ88_PUCGR|nr:hypothetical protein PGTUg99_018976 [Puccinia graminis f. sp. tritici]
MHDHREGQLDSLRDRSEDVVMDIDENCQHRPPPAESVLEPDARDEAERLPSAMNQNDPRNLSPDLQHRLEKLFAERADQVERKMTTRLQEFQLCMLHRIHDRIQSLIPTVQRRAAICFGTMCFKANGPEETMFDATLGHNHQFIAHIVHKLLGDQHQDRLEHYRCKIGSHVITLNDDYYNRLESYLTNLRNRYLSSNNMSSDPPTSREGM